MLSPSSPTATESSYQWQQGALIEVVITDLSDRGDGVGRVDQRVVFVPDTVTGDHVRVRLVHVKPEYAFGKLQEILEPSPNRDRPACFVADKCGGCQWQHVRYDYQLEAKRNQVIQALQRIGGFAEPPVEPVLSAGTPLAYRNKATFPLARSTAGQVQAGYYQKGSHHLINLNQCPIQDARLNPLLAEIKQDLHDRGWSIYNEAQHRCKLRHLALRIGRRTGEQLLTLVTADWNLPGLEEQIQTWRDRYPDLVGVCLNLNRDRTNAIFGAETRCLSGREYLYEVFAGLTFQIAPETFFQVNTEAAEALLYDMQRTLNLQGNELLVDAYCGIGTLTLPLAQQVNRAIGFEIQATAIAQAQQNAEINHIPNAEFWVGDVEPVLPGLGEQPDVVVLDPPRKGCSPKVLSTLIAQAPAQIAYMSCNPATLARDLKVLCQSGDYRLTRVQPADFFAQTAHVECVAYLVR